MEKPALRTSVCRTCCCPGASADESTDTDEQREWRSCSLLNAVVGCVHKCLLYNREDKDNTHDVGGLFTIDCMKLLMSPLVDQVTFTNQLDFALTILIVLDVLVVVWGSRRRSTNSFIIIITSKPRAGA